MSLPRLLSICAAATLLAAAPAAHAQQTPATPDHVVSDNVTYIGGLKLLGDGVGGRIVGNRFFVTSTTHLLVYDITNAEAPAMLGALTLDVEFENEDVPTNGKVLGISASLFGVNCATPSVAGSGCLNIYDVSTPAAPTLIKSVMGAGDHTQDCILDCQYFYGSEGTIVDARDPANAEIVGNWTEAAQEQGISFTSSPHDITEVAPGLIVTATQPILLMSANAADGGTPIKPVVLAQGVNEDNRFIHSTLWPNQGRDRFLLIGGETVLDGGQCSDQSAAFMTWNADKVRNVQTGGYNKGASWEIIDEVRMNNGTYVDGYAPVNYFGCSVHWFANHPSFKNGGLVAVSAYEHGTRLFQVTSEGKLVQQGFALPIGGAASAPHWHPAGKVFYTVDYQRGVDIWNYTGDTYVPADDGTLTPTPGATPGTGGQGADAPPCASAAGFREATAKGSGKGVKFDVSLREQRPFTVDVFQQSAGSTVIGERLVARFTNKTKSFTWNGTDRKGRKLASGNYFVRFTMKLASGAKDVRRATLARAGGKFKVAPDFYQRVDCGIFKSLKLTSSVFGGKSKRALGIAYKLALGASSVKITAKVGSKTIKTFTGKGTENRTFRFSVPASAAKRGQLVKVTITVDRGGAPAATTTLTAKRI